LKLQHNTLINKEDKIYTFNLKHKFNENLESLKALGLAFMLSKNPNNADTSKEL
jgi:hypothetical protein